MVLPTKVITLSDGKEIEVNISTLTQREYRSLFRLDTDDEQDEKVLARLCNVKTEYIASLLRDDFRRVIDAVVFLANRPLDDPNSRSGSTSQ